MVSVFARRSVSACALPRPSATASARLAKITVSHSQTTIHQTKTLGSVMAMIVDATAPTSTTNITGFFTITRGSSLRSASGREVSSIFGSNAPEAAFFATVSGAGGRGLHERGHSPSARGPRVRAGK